MSADQTSRLSVNVNAIAMLRNRRPDIPWPSVTGMAKIAMDAGAKGITIHPRPDQRHIIEADVGELADLVHATPGKEICLEGYPDDYFGRCISRAKPHQVLFVPDSPEQSTSDHGWSFDGDLAMLRSSMASAKSLGSTISLFIDPDPEAARKAAAFGAERIEIYTGPYGGCHSNPSQAKVELDKITDTASAAKAAGLGVNAGHDLTVDNIPDLIQRAPFIREVSIGHGFTADALIYGYAESVRRFRRALGEIS